MTDHYNPAAHIIQAQERHPNGKKRCLCGWWGTDHDMHLVAMDIAANVLDNVIEEEP